MYHSNKPKPKNSKPKPKSKSKPKPKSSTKKRGERWPNPKSQKYIGSLSESTADKRKAEIRKRIAGKKGR